ncbi:MAG: DegV family protein [Gracilibacteraceae bacterium]|jgi:DegV family protein with EDD domain|nr:DegV family protein [Gracilibacteraceae bacterium]
MVRIIVDSSCDLPDELLEEYEIKSVPQRIYLNDREYLDKVTINAKEVYEAMKKGIIPQTSLPRPMDISGFFKQCCQEGNDFIFIAISSKFSGTYQLAVSLMEEHKEQYGKVRMSVIDSKSGSTAIGLIALQATKLARAGLGFDMIVRQINELADYVEHIFMVQDLSWLVRGGRISKTEGIIGSILNVKPILHVKDGTVEILEKVRGRKKALDTIVGIMEERIRDFPDQTIGISYAYERDIANELRDMIIKRLGNRDIMINEIGAALTSHLGIGGVGVFFFNREPDFYME